MGFLSNVGTILWILLAVAVIFFNEWLFSIIPQDIFFLALAIFVILYGLYVIFNRRMGWQSSVSPSAPYAARSFLFRSLVRFIFGPVFILIGLITLLDFLREMLPYLSLESTIGLIITSIMGIITTRIVFHSFITVDPLFNLNLRMMRR